MDLPCHSGMELSNLSLEQLRQLENGIRQRREQLGYKEKLQEPPVEKSVWGNMAPIFEDVTTDDIREVATKLKQRRIAWGITQGQLGQLVCFKYGAKLSQTTVSRFEMMECTIATAKRLVKPMKEMIEIIDQIHADTGHQPPEVLCQMVRQNIGTVVPTVRERKRRVTYTDDQLATLDALFEQCESPTSAQLNRFAIALGLGFSEVRVWFCNRRQKRRKTTSPGKKETIEVNSEDSFLSRFLEEGRKDDGDGSLQKQELSVYQAEVEAARQKAPLIASLEGMPKEEIVINVSQDA